MTVIVAFILMQKYNKNLYLELENGTTHNMLLQKSLTYLTLNKSLSNNLQSIHTNNPHICLATMSVMYYAKKIIF